MSQCLINQEACGLEVGNPVCLKCGMDERVVYPGQADREAAQERAEGRYWKAHAKELEARVAKPAAPTPTPAQGQSFVLVNNFRDAPWAPQMVVLPSGKFLMGSPAGEPGRHENEGPQHEVTIGYKLALGKYPVTFEEWDACVADGGTQHKPKDQGWGRGKRPVINVSWNDAQQYVAWLNQKLGIAADNPTRYRLPSEAEWEYACRAGTTTAYWWGNEFEAARCNSVPGFSEWFKTMSSIFSDPTPQPVDALGAASINAWGLSGTHGNVLEWVSDCWNKDYTGSPCDGRVWTSGDCRQRVLRGGSWASHKDGVRSAFRVGFPSGDRHSVGFRLARTIS